MERSDKMDKMNEILNDRVLKSAIAQYKQYKRAEMLPPTSIPHIKTNLRFILRETIIKLKKLGAVARPSVVIYEYMLVMLMCESTTSTTSTKSTHSTYLCI